VGVARERYESARMVNVARVCSAWMLVALLACACVGEIEARGSGDGVLAAEGAATGSRVGRPTTLAGLPQAGTNAAGGLQMSVAGSASRPSELEPSAMSLDCAQGQSRCGGECKSLASDALHCGACGHACATGLQCHEGTCRCAAGFDVCAASCVEIARDAKHCGGCGRACAATEICTAGQCGCGAGQLRCGNNCVSVVSDRANCGACGQACDAGDRCERSQCVLDCTGSTVACGEVCADVTRDAANCGSCGMACPAGMTCTRSRCR
jgi:hypothetical protein